MKTKFWTKRKTMSVIAMSVAIVLAALICVPTLTANANYTGQSGGMTREQLHSATLATSVSGDTPAITVLMHGLYGKAADWSNQMQWDSDEDWTGTRTFTADNASIIEKMRNTASSGMQLFRAATSGESSFSLYSEYSNTEVLSIPDFSKHTLLVMDMSNTASNTMESLYARLHYVLDKISYDYYVQKGTLPRINLIGHSMGGLLNMQYAIEHPKNVAALVSLGTPYNGSWYDNWFVEMIGITSFREQPCISGTCGHSYYFCDVETRKNKWNEVYAQNPHIKFYALSGETSLDILTYIVMYSKCLEVHAKLNAAEAVALRAGYSVLGLITSFLPGDICVDTDSQKAVGYDGVINYNKRFSRSNSDINKRAQKDFPVPHNLETYDSDMHNCILKLIDYGNNTTYHSYTQHGMKVGIIAKSDNKWLIQLTNNTGSAQL